MTYLALAACVVVFLSGRRTRTELFRARVEVEILKAERSHLREQRNELLERLAEAESMGHAVASLRERGLQLVQFARPIVVSPERRSN